MLNEKIGIKLQYYILLVVIVNNHISLELPLVSASTRPSKSFNTPINITLKVERSLPKSADDVFRNTNGRYFRGWSLANICVLNICVLKIIIKKHMCTYSFLCSCL